MWEELEGRCKVWEGGVRYMGWNRLEVGRCWKVLVGVGVCQWVSEGVGVCQRVLEGVGGCWRVSEGVGGCRWGFGVR